MWQQFISSSDTLARLILSLSVAVVMSLFIAWTYRLTHRGMNYEQSFITTMVMIAPVVTLVMFFIRGDLVLSLGLVGSLSIIRFRTPIKDTRDMAYLFWIIAVGLGSGTENWLAVAAASIFIALVTFTLTLLGHGRSSHSDYVLVVAGESDYPVTDVEQAINSSAARIRIRSQEIQEGNWEVIFEVRFIRNGKKPYAMLENIRSINGVQRVSLLAPQLALPM